MAVKKKSRKLVQRKVVRKAPRKSPAKKTAAPQKKGRAISTPLVSKRGFLDYIKAGIEIAKLNEQTIIGVSNDKSAFWNGVAIVAIVGAAIAVGSLQPWTLAFLVPLVVLGSFVNTGVSHLIALILGGKARFVELYRARSMSYVLYWPMVIPFLGMFAAIFLSLWDIVVLVVTIRTVHQLSTGRAIVVVLLPIILVSIVVMLFALALILAKLAGNVSFLDVRIW